MNDAVAAYEEFRKVVNQSPESTQYLLGWDTLPEWQRKAWSAVVKAMEKETNKGEKK